MSTERTTKPAGPLRCSRCSDEDGPFTKDGLCEDCTPRAILRSALEDGGHLGEVGARLMNNYAEAVLLEVAETLRNTPDCEQAAGLVAWIAGGRLK